MGRKTTRRSNPGRKVADRAGRYQERQRLAEHVGVTGSLRICSIAGRMRRNREAKAALGGRSAAAAETEKDHRIRQLERPLDGSL